MRISGIVLAASLLAFGSSGARAASIIGSTVDVKYLFPNSTTALYDSGSSVVSGSTNIFFPDELSVSFSPSTIIITDSGPGAFNNTSFDGVEVSFLSGFNPTSVSIDPSSASAFTTGSVLSLSGNNVFLNLGGTCAKCIGNEVITLDVGSGAVVGATPEPQSFALLGTGLLGLVGIARRRLA